MDADELRDYEDQGMMPTHHSPGPASGLSPYAKFMSEMPDWINMTQEEYVQAWEALPMPAVGPVPPGISHKQAILVRKHIYLHNM